METRVSICVLCGIPGSGKTSFCKRINSSFGSGYLIINVNYDKLLLSSNSEQAQFHKDLFKKEDEMEGNNLAKTARRHVLKLVEIILQTTHKDKVVLDFESNPGWSCINQSVRESFMEDWKKTIQNEVEDCQNMIILVDDNMYLRSMRYEFYKIARQYSTGFCQVFIDSPLEDALERNKMRKGLDLINPEIITIMAQKMEPPDPVRNGWEKSSIKLNTEENTDLAVLFLQESFANPVQPSQLIDKEEQFQSQQTCSKSILHQSDLILRKCVAKTIENGKKDNLNMKYLSRQAISVKDDIMKNLKRDGNIITLDSSNVEDASKDENSDLYKFIYDLFEKKLKS